MPNESMQCCIASKNGVETIYNSPKEILAKKINSKCGSSKSISSYNNNNMKTPDKKDATIPYNPFHCEIGSLSLPAFSPSVFSMQKVQKSCLDESKNTFRWSIEQIAALRPADIDETFHQSTLQELDEKSEEEAQKAIQSFFSQNSIAPSPWGVPLTNHDKKQPTLITEEINTSSMSSNSIQQKFGKTVSTQTNLTFPNDVDLNNLLSQYFTVFNQDQKNNPLLYTTDDSLNEKDSISSLRRKLFSPNGVNVVSPRKTQDYKTPEKQSTLSLTSCSGHFSSSPISLKNFSISSLVTHPMNPLPISPISADRADVISPISRKQINKNLSLKSERQFWASPDLRKSYLKSTLKFSPESPLQSKSSSLSEDNVNNDEEVGIKNGSSLHYYQQSSVLSVSMLSDLSSDSPEMDLQQTEIRDMKVDSFLKPTLILEEEEENENIVEIQSMASQDYGYQTASLNSIGGATETNSLNQQQEFNCEKYNKIITKELKAAKLKSIGDSNALLESCVEMDIEFRQRLCSLNEQNGVEMFLQDSVMHISQSSWKPTVYSTPH